MTIVEMFSDPLLVKIIIKALIVGGLVSLCASLLGVSLVLKRFSMIGDGLSHVGFCVLAIATVLGLKQYSLELGVPAVIITAFFLLRLTENSKMKGDSALALISTGSIALGSLIYNFSDSRNTDICNSLFGSASIITLTDKDLVLSIVLSVAVIVLFALSYHKLFAITFDENFSKATGIKVNLYNILLAVLTAVTVVVGMRMMGAIMISALVVFPALSAMRVCKSFKWVVIVSAIISIVTFVVGFFLACRMSFQTGATVVSVQVATFAIFAIIGAIISGKIFKRIGG
jgi:zinc transport system permease protein